MSNWNIERLSSDVQHKVIATDGVIQSVLFANEPYLGKPTEVFAYLGIPEGVTKPGPAMVCVHGGGGTAFKQWVELWVRRGYAAIAMDLSGRDGDRNRLANGGPEQDHKAKFNTDVEWKDLWTYHAIAAIMRANTIIRGLPTVDPERVGITGISWGGYLTCIASGVDHRFACAAPVYGCGFLQHNSADDWMEIFASMTPAQRQAWRDKCDPSVYLKDAAMPMLFVSGTNDFAYPLDILQMSCALPQGDVTRCVRLEMPHGHEPGWAPEEIGVFADHHLKGEAPLPTIGDCRLEQDLISADCCTTLPIKEAHLLYTQSQVRWRERKWQIARADVIGDIVQASLPQNTTACFLAIEDDRQVYVSSTFIEP